jgi:Spy/CpxP family protein refolding chaperone
MRKVLAAAALAALFVPAVAQTGKPDAKDGTPAVEKKEFLLDVSQARAKTGRVPNGYGQIGLTRDQKERIYGIQAAYSERIKQVEAELEQLKAEQIVQIKNVLSDQQKSAIENYEARTKSRRSAAAP